MARNRRPRDETTTKAVPQGGDEVVDLPVADDLRPFVQALADMILADLLAPGPTPKSTETNPKELSIQGKDE